MIVLKFGGTSLSTVESISSVRKVCESQFRSRDGVVVVSAVGGTTDLLVECADKACGADTEYLSLVKEIESRHVDLCKALFPPNNQSSVLAKTKILINDLEDVLKGVSLVHEASFRTMDYILSFGESLSSTIIYEYFRLSIPQTGFFDPVSFIITDNQHGSANVDLETTQNKIQEKLIGIKGPAVCPGFIAGTAEGTITTLGRGGSDYTAAIIAAALNVEELQIWTDVDGMMTADPRFVSSAHPIPEISYEEALELSHFGAKVIYPPSIQPALKQGVPIQIRNTFNPEAKGTRIAINKNSQGSLIKGLSSIQDISIFNLKGAGMVGIPNFSNRLFGALSRMKINVILITQASSEHTICVGISEQDLPRSLEAIKKEFEMEMQVGKIDELETESDLSIIALVGANMHHQVGVSGKMFSTLGENGINVVAIAQGSSERNISAVISSRHLKKALNILHERFFLSERKLVNLFIIGVGTVGGTFIRIIEEQQKALLADYQIDIRITGIANSKKMYFDPDGIVLSGWKESLDGGEKMDRMAFFEKMISMNLRSSIFIDNTASEVIPFLYNQILENSISIVTPNKIACSSAQESYDLLHATSRKFNSKFLYETNVGAGLPVISTLNDLIKSGDKVKRIDAVLSGSLNFIFNHYDGSSTFAEIVKKAQEEGYTEPDPRIDLSGKDVMRKILILIRESGNEMEMDQIENDAFVPAECMGADSVSQFYDLLAKSEPHFRKIYEEASKSGRRIKFTASFDGETAKAGLMYYDHTHPFFRLEGKDNIVLYTTDRYAEQPLVIKGAGAGADVTASGIFADVIRIANT